MNTLFLGIVIFLIVLAVFDLVVGVSNDAVNFLNSAIGARVAKSFVISLLNEFVCLMSDWGLRLFRISFARSLAKKDYICSLKFS